MPKPVPPGRVDLQTMIEIPHWTNSRTICVAQSKGGVLVTRHPDDNLIASVSPWPTPELLQKYYASARFRGRTPDDQEAAQSGLGHYCDLQSLNSEDAITWSFFGNLAYAEAKQRLDVLNGILGSLGFPYVDDPPVCWLWRRLPHPEKPDSTGGPEIDFGFLSKTTLLLGEAKWNSRLGQKQGVNRDRSQLDLRAGFCEVFAKRFLPTVNNIIVLGVGRSATVFNNLEEYGSGVKIGQLSWEQLCGCFREPTATQLNEYLSWKNHHSSPAA